MNQRDQQQMIEARATENERWLDPRRHAIRNAGYWIGGGPILKAPNSDQIPVRPRREPRHQNSSLDGVLRW